MANNIIGTNGSIGPPSTWNTVPSQPHWNTATATPYAAPMESRFMITALIGTRIDRNQTNKHTQKHNNAQPKDELRRTGILRTARRDDRPERRLRCVRVVEDRG